jgi:hypothetical protein
MSRFLQVEGHQDLVRDTESGAIINRNRSAYEIRAATREINNIKCEMHEIKGLLQKLVSKE